MVTVLMAVRDTPAAQLRQAMDSIRRQTFADFEFLVLDDGSREPATLADLARQRAADPRVRLETGAHRGLTRTLNRGLEMASRDWIARQDADDWSDPERLALQLAFLRARPGLRLCGTNAWTHRHDGAPLWPTRLPETAGEVRQAFWTRNPFVHGSTLFSAAAARAAGGYREEFPCAQDYDFFWRLAESGGAANLPQPLYHYRYGGGAVSARRAGEQARAHRAAQILAEQRRRAIPEHAIPEHVIDENVAAAWELAGRTARTREGVLRAALKQADHSMLAGSDAWGTGRAFLRLWAAHPGSPLAWAKLARWAVFSALPPARRICFR